KTELLGFLVYYNEHRPHSALNNLTPKLFAQNM
ncbi:MAG: integrase core domain-containing protein, partial [Alphaproteobacteria bacterium]|nr:integrase core domain-containing protein [Alphaproteobacteria bacterium]